MPTSTTLPGLFVSGVSGFSGAGASGASGYSGPSGYSGYSGISGYSGFSSESGVSGYSGYSGTSGYSGGSGYSGYSGVSGYSGYSGVSGYSGYSGVSGFSGYSGTSGYSGGSGFSGYSGYSGFSSFSGYSGFSGISGFSGQAGSGLTERTIEVVGNTTGVTPATKLKVGRLDVLSFDPSTDNGQDFVFEIPDDMSLSDDLSVILAYHMATAFSGNVRLQLTYEIVDEGEDTTPASSTTLTSTITPSTSAEIREETGFTVPGGTFTTATQSIRFSLLRDGDNGADTHTGAWNLETINVRYVGVVGTSGFSGFSSASGTSGYSGPSGYSGYSGYSGQSGYSGYSGVSGFSAYSGVSGYSGYSGTSGYSGYSGTSGFSSFSGHSGYSGVSGYSGYSGYSGTSGFSAYSGTSGYSGYSGVSGYSGYSGYSGFSGFSSFSGFSGTAASGGGTGVAIKQTFTQTAHGFSSQEALFVSGFSFYRAKADNPDTSDVVGVVESVTINTFDLVFAGAVSEMSGFSAGLPYFLSDLTAGQLTPTPPTSIGSINKPVLFARDEDDAIVQIQRGVEVSSTIDTLAVFTPLGNMPPAFSFASPDTRNSHSILDFDDTSIEQGMFGSVLNRRYTGNGITVTIAWLATSATSGNVVWGVSFERHDDEGTDLDSDSFATEKTVTSAAPSTSGAVQYASISFGNSEIDGLLVGESYRLRIRRVANDGSDTMSGDAEMLRVEVRGT